MSVIHELEEPAAPAECTPEEILTGPRIEPRDHIRLYSDVKFEQFIEEWAFYYLQKICKEYVRVRRFGGAGDKGRDVIGYVNEDCTPVICDVFQCKHYKDAITPSDLFPEVAKLCWHTFNETIPLPRNYYVVAPQDIGASVGRLLENTDNLRSDLQEMWKKETGKRPLYKRLGTAPVKLEGEFEEYVCSFNFEIIKHKPILEVIEEFRLTNRFAQRFGGGLTKPLPDTSVPSCITSNETRYVQQLLDVYAHDSGRTDIEVNQLLTSTCRDGKHFCRSRERFYHAETLREFTRDNLPPNYEFRTVQDVVLDEVMDTFDRTYPTAIERVESTTDAAVRTVVGDHPLKPYLKGQSLRGICHQLANDDKLVWLEGGTGATE